MTNKEKNLAMNEQTIQYEKKEIPLSLYAKTIKIEDKTIRYSEMFPKLMIPPANKILPNVNSVLR